MSAFLTAHWIFLSLLFVTVVCAMSGAALFDALLKYEYKFCRDQWEADGCVPGLFWTAPDATDMVSSDIHSQRLIWRWLFFTPDWISGLKPLERKLNALRAASLIGMLAGALLVIHSAM